MKLANTPAYPHVEHNDDGTYWLTHQGLTKRELFAAMAMQGLLSDNSSLGYLEVARDAVKHADALIYKLETPND
jgi:hypothetical protein